MPPPLPVPVRRAIFQLWQQHQTPLPIAEALALNPVTVRRLVRGFRLRGREAILPRYDRTRTALDSDLARAALQYRRDHPTWGAGLIRVFLLETFGPPVPATRTLQRWFLQAELAPAPSGRRRGTSAGRATVVHATWQMDAKERIRIRTNEEVSWLRIVDECSGAVLSTTVFPPRAMVAGPGRGRARGPAAGLRPLGAAGILPGRQRPPVGIAGGVAHGAVVVADRLGDPDDLESARAA